MDSKNQIQIFLSCVLVGFLCGLIYEIFVFFRLLFGCERGKRSLFGGILDFLFFLFSAIFCVVCGFLLRFPSIRVYMWVGYVLGGVLYAKSLRRMVAFSQKKCYNIGRKIATKVKYRKKLSKEGEENYDTR